MEYINYSEELKKVTLPRFNEQYEKQVKIELERNGFINPNRTSKVVVTPKEKLVNKTTDKLKSEQVDTFPISEQNETTIETSNNVNL